jgi:hypothetical protein
MKTKIIGVMAAKNLVSQGYPFLEAIYSFLNWGDELYVGDDSSDETYAILSRIAKNKRIKVFKLPWKNATKKGKAIGIAYNDLIKTVKRKVKPNDFIYELQSNEITHEDIYEEMRALPEQYPYYKGYFVPLKEMVGIYSIRDGTYRFRLAKASNNMAILGDGGRIDLIRDVSPLKFLGDELKTIFRYISPGMYSIRTFRYLTFDNRIKVPVLSNSIFRYSVIFPVNYIKKLQGHKKLYQDKKFMEVEKLYKLKNNPDRFYFKLASHLCKTYVENRKVPVKLEPEKHPEIMRGIINSDRYVIRSDLVENIIKMNKIMY